MSRALRVTRAVLNGAILRCPTCHQGRMSDGLFHMHHRCPRCGALFEPARGEFTGAVMFGMGFLGFVALMGYFVLHYFMETPAWFEFGWVGFWSILFPLLFYRNMKGVWVGVLHGFDTLPGHPHEAR